MLQIIGGNQRALRRYLAAFARENPALLVIVPEQYTLQTERELMNGLNVPGFFDLEVLSPSRLTERVFAAGTSAGAMISLDMAFRPLAPGRARICAVGNFWGSVSDLKVLDYADTPILSFQSENDPIMPYSKGYPFQSRLGCFSFLMGLFSNKMYGTYAIYQKALEKGIACEHHACPETGHRLHMNKDGQFTPRFYEMRDAMAAFFSKC